MVRHVLLLGLIAALATGMAPASTCQYVLVADPCDAKVHVYRVGDAAVLKTVDLRDGGTNKIGRITWSTVDGLADHVAIVTQGHYVRAVDVESCSPDVLRDFDLGAASGLGDVVLSGIAAAPGRHVSDKSVQYPLYVAGTSGGTPYYFVLDQQALLDGHRPSAVLLAQGPLCPSGGSCSGTAQDVAAAGAAGGEPEHAFVAVWALDEAGTRRQRFFRVARDPFSTAAWSVELSSFNEGLAWSGGRHRHHGIAFDRQQEIPLGGFQTAGDLGNLLTGARSCPVGGAPLALDVWGPSASSDVGALQFVTYEDASGSHLAVSPLMECADPGGGSSDSLISAVPAGPVAIDLSNRSDGSFWAYVAGKDVALVRGLRYSVEPGLLTPTVSVLETLDLPTGDCPLDVAIGAPASVDSSCGDPPCAPGSDWPSVPCCLDDDDPDPSCVGCIENQDLEGPDDDDVLP
jgi:hypothetical protein